MHKCILTFLPIESGSMATGGHLSSEDGCLTLETPGILNWPVNKNRLQGHLQGLSMLPVLFKNHRRQATFCICDLRAFLAESASSFWPCVTVAFPQQTTLLSEAFISCVLDEGWPSLTWQHPRGPGFRVAQVFSSGSLSAALGPYLAPVCVSWYLSVTLSLSSWWLRK